MPATLRELSEATAARKRFRLPRSCERCRRVKVKCVLDGARCDACVIAGVGCTWANPALIADRPPTRKEVDQLTARIRSLERLLDAVDPAGAYHSRNESLEIFNGQGDSTPGSLVEEPVVAKLTPAPPPPCWLDYDDGDDDGSDKEGVDECVALAGGRPGDSNAGFHLGPHAILNDPTCLPGTMATTYETFIPGTGAQQSPPIVDRVLVEHFLTLAKSRTVEIYPPPDLETELIGLYFECVHPFFPILHPSFIALHMSGQADGMPTFKALCLAVFALASRYCNDPRVMTDHDGKTLQSRQAAGYCYANGAMALTHLNVQPLDLYELQANAILTRWALGALSPMTAWWYCGVALQRAQDGGAHRERSAWWSSNPLRNYLRRRAFYSILVTESLLSVALGRATILPRNNYDLKFGNPQLDAEFKMFDAHRSAAPKFNVKLMQDTYFGYHTSCYTHRSIVVSVADQLHNIGWFGVGKVNKQDAAAFLRSAIKKLDLASERLDKGENTVWSPTIADDGQFVLITNVTTLQTFLKHLYLRKLFMVDKSDREVIKACLKTGRDIIVKIEAVRKRGLLEYCWDWVPIRVMTTAVSLFWGRGSGDPIMDQPDPELHGASCLEVARLILATLAPTNYTAQRAYHSLTRMAMAQATVTGTTSVYADAKPALVPPASSSPTSTFAPASTFQTNPPHNPETRASSFTFPPSLPSLPAEPNATNSGNESPARQLSSTWRSTSTTRIGSSDPIPCLQPFSQSVYFNGQIPQNIANPNFVFNSCHPQQLGIGAMLSFDELLASAYSTESNLFGLQQPSPDSTSTKQNESVNVSNSQSVIEPFVSMTSSSIPPSALPLTTSYSTSNTNYSPNPPWLSSQQQAETNFSIAQLATFLGEGGIR